MTGDIIAKFCPKCGENLPASAFYKDKSRRDGLQSRCRVCQKAWHEANPGYKRAWLESNQEKDRAYQKTYRKANPEVYKAANHRRRARELNAEGDHNSAQATARTAVHGDSCIYCASTKDLHLDHIKPLSKGGSNWAANLAPACATCNKSKNDKWGEDLLRWVEQNCTVERTRKILGFVLHTAE